MISARRLTFLKALVSITFLARGWLTYRWDSPIRGLFWNEEFVSPLIQKWFGIGWQEFAANSDQSITIFLEVCGIILMVSAFIPWLPVRKRLACVLIVPAMLILFCDTLARYVGSGFQLGMLIEHALQVGVALVWLLANTRILNLTTWMLIGKVMVALTFIGHGLYAFGFHPVPWDYQLMTRSLLGLSETGAIQFLRIAGFLDFVVGVAVFIRAIEKPVLVYIVIWGALTALARIASHPTNIDPWLAETLVRSAHWGVPVVLLFSLKTVMRFRI